MAAANVVPSPGPATKAYTITPADSELTDWLRAIYVGGAGNVKVTTTSDDAVTFSGVPAGTVLPICVKQIWSTGTTATLMVGLR